MERNKQVPEAYASGTNQYSRYHPVCRRKRPLSGARVKRLTMVTGSAGFPYAAGSEPAFRKPARAGDCGLHSRRLTPAAGSLSRWTAHMAPSTHPCEIMHNLLETGPFVNPAVLVDFWPEREVLLPAAACGYLTSLREMAYN